MIVIYQFIDVLLSSIKIFGGFQLVGFSSKISKIKKWYVSSKIYMGNSPANTGGDNEFVKIIVTPFWGTQFLDKPICWFKNALGQWNILRPFDFKTLDGTPRNHLCLHQNSWFGRGIWSFQTTWTSGMIFFKGTHKGKNSANEIPQMLDEAKKKENQKALSAIRLDLQSYDSVKPSKSQQMGPKSAVCSQR